MSEIWVTSDLHFYHKNVIKYCDRPYNSVEEMNDGLIENWNKEIKDKDTIYLLGDFCLTSRIELIEPILLRLNGSIHFIRGNHDKFLKRFDGFSDKAQDKFLSISDIKEKTFTFDKKQKFIMCHYPMVSWHGSYYGAMMLHGHCHGDLNNHGIRRYDVGVDNNNMKPCHIDHVYDRLSIVEGFVDHHGAD